MKDIVWQILLMVLLVAVQVLVLDNLQLQGGISTFVAFNIYFFYLLILPLNTSYVYLLIVSFLLGLALDLFADTLGVHAATCVFVGFMRIQVLRIFFANSREQNNYTVPSIYLMGSIPFIYYTLILSFCFHLALCSLEIFTFYKFYFTFIRIILSTLTSTIMMMIFQLLFVKKTR
jgi:rod shape-determining protein MreD